MPKRRIQVGQAVRLVNHGPTVLASCLHRDRRDIITLAWCMPVSVDPILIAISVSPKRFSHDLIARSREYVVNVPPSRLLDAVWRCGTVSGRDEDKFETAGLTAVPGHVVAAPLVAECLANIECRVVKTVTVGDHSLFVGEVVSVSVESEAFDTHLRLRGPYHTLHHLGGPQFVTSAGTRLVAG